MAVATRNDNSIGMKSGHRVKCSFETTAWSFNQKHIVALKSELFSRRGSKGDPGIPGDGRKSISCFLQHRAIGSTTFVQTRIKIGKELHAISALCRPEGGR